MKQLIKAKALAVYCAFAALFVLLALLGNWEGLGVWHIFIAPLTWLGDGMRKIGDYSMALAYTVYIGLGLVPLVFSAVRIIKTKKLVIRDICWIALTAFLYVVMYFFINPHNLDVITIMGVAVTDPVEDMRKIMLTGYAITAFAILLFALLAEFYAKLKKTDKNAYLYAKILLSVFILLVLFNLLFIELANAKAQIKGVATDFDIINLANVNKGANILVIVLGFIIDIAPAAVTILLLLQSSRFIDSLQADAFCGSNIPRLNAIAKTCVITVFVSLGAVIAKNVLVMLFLHKLMKIYFTLSVPVAMILIACLVLIFSKILIRAIKLSEENKLVI